MDSIDDEWIVINDFQKRKKVSSEQSINMLNEKLKMIIKNKILNEIKKNIIIMSQKYENKIISIEDSYCYRPIDEQHNYPFENKNIKLSDVLLSSQNNKARQHH